METNEKGVFTIRLKGTEILMKVLKEEGVETIFGFPGGAVLDIYDALVKTDIRHILVRHEQGAVHAADGYARASGRVGVCLVTSGPGATNTVTGISSAYMDSVPLVIFTGQVNTRLIGNDAFQEVDIVGITRPCTKHNYLIKDVKDLARTVKEAFYIARSGRPGPVLVDLPKDMMQSYTDYKPIRDIKLRSYQPTYEPNVKQLAKVVNLIKNSKKPMIFAGGGVILSGASRELKLFANRIQAPVTTSLMGLGGFPASDPLWLGMIGMHGTYRANMASATCDLMIAIGVRFDDRVTGKVETFASKAQIDIDPTSISKNVRVAIPIVGDCTTTIRKLNRLLAAEDLKGIKKARKPWMDQIVEWKSTRPLAYEQKDIIKPQYVVEKI